MKSKILSNAQKIKHKKKTAKIVKLSLLIFLLILLILYVIVGIIYNSGTFSITLDRNLYLEKGIIIYDDPDYKVFRSELKAETLDYFDNTSYKWFPDDLDDHDGSHNGENYLAYTFYVENMGQNKVDYWYELVIDDVIKDVDESVRIRIYKNGEYITYAKVSKDGTPEPDTSVFASDNLIKREQVKDFGPGDIDKYTIVLWLEGSDPECTDNILGGEFKFHMNFNSEIINE